MTPEERAAKQSPSSRRAWIEIGNTIMKKNFAGVALLAEGVDRNFLIAARTGNKEWVALLAEGVDRNTRVLSFASKPMRRPPRGGRG